MGLNAHRPQRFEPPPAGGPCGRARRSARTGVRFSRGFGFSPEKPVSRALREMAGRMIRARLFSSVQPVRVPALVLSAFIRALVPPAAGRFAVRRYSPCPRLERSPQGARGFFPCVGFRRIRPALDANQGRKVRRSSWSSCRSRVWARIRFAVRVPQAPRPCGRRRRPCVP